MGDGPCGCAVTHLTQPAFSCQQIPGPDFPCGNSVCKRDCLTPTVSSLLQRFLITPLLCHPRSSDALCVSLLTGGSRTTRAIQTTLARSPVVDAPAGHRDLLVIISPQQTPFLDITSELVRKLRGVFATKKLEYRPFNGLQLSWSPC